MVKCPWKSLTATKAPKIPFFELIFCLICECELLTLTIKSLDRKTVVVQSSNVSLIRLMKKVLLIDVFFLDEKATEKEDWQELIDLRDDLKKNEDELDSYGFYL